MWSHGIKESSTFGRTMANNFGAKFDLSWVDHNHWVTWLNYHLITLYYKKGGSQVSQHQWPSDLVGLWVRMKGAYLICQVTCQSSDQVLFEAFHVSTNARSQNSAGGIKHRKTHKSKGSDAIQKILAFDSHQYTPL